MADERQLFPPDTVTVARRIFCLGAFYWRSQFESVAQSVDHRLVVDMQREEATQFDAWLDLEGLSQYLSPKERVALAKPFGTWSEQQIVDASWRFEAIGMLLWSLGRAPTIPPYDTPFPVPKTSRLVGWRKPIHAVATAAKLRPRGEITAARDVAETWHWRSRAMFVMQRTQKPAPGFTWERVLNMTAASMDEQGHAPKPIDGDLPLFGKTYAELSDDEYATAASIAVDRHFALNWLCGYAPDWDSTPTDT